MYQNWTDEEFCALYESMWEISTDEVHYGWLSPGELSLKLLDGISLASSRVLDLGCGMGQNLIALAKQGASCVGLDISKCMIRRAEALVKQHGFEEKIALRVGDMREPKCFEHSGNFDLVLSIYSMEYLSNLRELRRLLYSIYKRLVSGGVLVFCFSHALQASRYPELMNRSIPIGVGKYRTFNYSFKDVTEALFKSGFTVERIIEQSTPNPSMLSYEQSKIFPYHFYEGMNPCKSDFDDLSNGAPHTVIYKVRKHHDPLHGLPRRNVVNVKNRDVWGYKRTIIRSQKIHFLGFEFIAQYFAPMDNVLGLLDVLNYAVTAYDLSRDAGDIMINVDINREEYPIDGNSVLGLIHRKLTGLGLDPVYKDSAVSTEEDEFEWRVYLADIAGLGELVKQEFGTAKVGILVFVNGHEPVRGELPIDQVMASVGDKIVLAFVALSSTGNDGRRGDMQLQLNV